MALPNYELIEDTPFVQPALERNARWSDVFGLKKFWKAVFTRKVITADAEAKLKITKAFSTDLLATCQLCISGNVTNNTDFFIRLGMSLDENGDIDTNGFYYDEILKKASVEPANFFQGNESELKNNEITVIMAGLVFVLTTNICPMAPYAQIFSTCNSAIDATEYVETPIVNEVIGLSDETAGPYIGLEFAYEMKESSVIITAKSGGNTLTITDNGAGGFTGDVGTSLEYDDVVGEGDGLTDTFVLSPPAHLPILPNSVTIIAGDEDSEMIVIDDGAGNLIGDIGTGVNTIDYNTGIASVTFEATPVAEAPITMTSSVSFTSSIDYELKLCDILFNAPLDASPNNTIKASYTGLTPGSEDINCIVKGIFL